MIFGICSLVSFSSCYAKNVAREQSILTQSAINGNGKPLGAQLWAGGVLIPLMCMIILAMENTPCMCLLCCNNDLLNTTLFLHGFQGPRCRPCLKQRPLQGFPNLCLQWKKRLSGCTMRKPWPGSKRCSSKITDDEGKDHIDMELLTSPPETLQEELQQARENRY